MFISFLIPIIQLKDNPDILRFLEPAQKLLEHLLLDVFVYVYFQDGFYSLQLAEYGLNHEENGLVGHTLDFDICLTRYRAQEIDMIRSQLNLTLQVDLAEVESQASGNVLVAEVLFFLGGLFALEVLALLLGEETDDLH